jgi:hypothetical protein
MEELKAVSVIIAVIVSFWSLYRTYRFWLLSNRPIVVAQVIENSSGIGVACFDLVVYNCGNRPATHIVIQAKKGDIDQIISEQATEIHRSEIYGIFSETSKIALLLNGKDTATGFFSFSNNPDSEANILKYEAELPIKIKYSDIEGRKYVSKMTLFIRDSKGFGGCSVWE